jgi:hypothetical protein
MAAANRAIKLTVLILIIAAAVTAILLTRSRDGQTLSPEDDKFANVFIDMALAREMAGNCPDSIDILYDHIFEQYDVDSTWLLNYIAGISSDAEKQKVIWDVIVEKLDSLKRNPETDSLPDQNQSSSTNADSI